jgi:predicted amino acid racemase
MHSLGRTPAKENPVDYEHLQQVIDYHISLLQRERCRVGDTVVLGIYTRAQMTRSHVVPVSGISEGQPTVCGIFDHANTMLDEDYGPIAPKESRRAIDQLLERY